MNGYVGNRTKLESDFGAGSSHVLEPVRAHSFRQPRRHQVELDQLRALRRRHDSRQIMRVGEERKHLRQGNSNPMLDVETLAHGFSRRTDYTARPCRFQMRLQQTPIALLGPVCVPANGLGSSELCRQLTVSSGIAPTPTVENRLSKRKLLWRGWPVSATCRCRARSKKLSRQTADFPLTR